MRITCTTCGTPYEVDESRIPPGGATMKCTQCHAAIQVRLPGPTGPAPGGPSRFYLRRRTGKVFGPFVVQAIASMLEQGKLEGDEQVSPDGETWMPMSRVPALAAYAKDEGPVPVGFGDVEDLPAPKRNVPDLPGLPQPLASAPPSDDFADLPAPKGAIVPPAPPAPPAAPPPGGFDLGGFDHSPAGGGRELDLGGDDFADLPAPKGPSAPPFPGFSTGSGYEDLPAPRQPAPPPPPTTGLEYGQLDLGGDDEYADLPAPKQEISGLPAPKQGAAAPFVPPPPGFSPAPPPPGFSPSGGITDLPAPKGGITDLPAPKGGVTDLPAPKDGITDLPGPKSGLDYGQLDLGGAGLDDLPMPAGKGGLELDSDFDLPAPKEEDGLEPVDAPDLVQPKRDLADELFADAGDAVDVVAPKPAMEEDGFGPAPAVQQPRAPSTLPGPADFPMGLDEDLEIKRPNLFKRKLLMGGLAGGAFIIVVGIALGLLTPFGFFGVGLLTGEYSDVKEGRDLVKSGKQTLRLDTSSAYDRAAADFEQASKKLSEDGTPLALQLQALAASLVRFGANPAKRSAAVEIAGRLGQIEERTFEVEKSLALWTLALNTIPDALTKLGAVSGKEPGDAQAAVYLGWAQLAAAKPAEAKTTFARAMSADATNAAALFGAARAEEALGNKPGALSLLDKALAASPKHPGALLLKGALLLDAGKKKEAEQTLRTAVAARDLASRPELSMINTRLADLARIKGDANEARTSYQTALKIDPANFEAQTGLGLLYFSARRLADALEHFEKAMGTAPTDLQAAVGAARCYILLAEPLKAQKILQQLRQYHPKAPEIPFLLGRVEASVNNLDAAAENFKTALKQSPTYVPAYRHLSQVYVKQNRVQQALDLLATANKHLPGSPLVRDAEGMVHLATGDPSAAKTKFEEALRLDPSLNDATFHLGMTLMQQGQLEEAKQRFLAVHKKDPSFPGLPEALGDLYVQLGEFKEAALSYDRALEVDRPSDETRLGAAKAYNLAGEWDKALKQTEKVLEATPTESRARALRAEARLGQEKLDDALVEIRQAVDRDRRAEYLVIMGRVHAARREFADAIDAYRDALKLEPTRFEVRFERAKLLVKGGAVRDGIKELKKVLKVKPNLAEAHLYMGIALAESNKEAQAIASFQTAVAKRPDLGEAYFRMAQIQSDRRKHGAALHNLKKAVANANEADTWRDDAFYLLGTTAKLEGQKKVACTAFETYVKIAPPAAAATRKDALKQLRDMGCIKPKPED